MRGKEKKFTRARLAQYPTLFSSRLSYILADDHINFFLNVAVISTSPEISFQSIA